MSIADLVRRLQSRADTTVQALPSACGSVRTVAPGANTIFQPVRTREPAPILAIGPVFAPVAPFAPKTVEVRESFDESAPSGAAATCAGCRHFTRRRTCLEPVKAGLLTAEEGFGIVWPPDGYGTECAAFSGR